MEKLKEFMEFLRKEPNAADLFGDKEKPKNLEEQQCILGRL